MMTGSFQVILILCGDVAKTDTFSGGLSGAVEKKNVCESWPKKSQQIT